MGLIHIRLDLDGGSYHVSLLFVHNKSNTATGVRGFYKLGKDNYGYLEPLEFKTNQRGIYIVAKGVKWLLQSSPDT